ncbi:hypothetical protein V1478_000427 [Vespula squamosa]|uniref:Uncharacterized protein n=1 Tax=Vespula squamosa TaxID=30214 RepID=A0ABD2C5G4_VESSQ
MKFIIDRDRVADLYASAAVAKDPAHSRTRNTYLEKRRPAVSKNKSTIKIRSILRLSIYVGIKTEREKTQKLTKKSNIRNGGSSDGRDGSGGNTWPEKFLIRHRRRSMREVGVKRLVSLGTEAKDFSIFDPISRSPEGVSDYSVTSLLNDQRVTSQRLSHRRHEFKKLINRIHRAKRKLYCRKTVR